MRPLLEVADIFLRHGAAWRAAQAGHVSLAQLKVMSAIETCRTAALGGHIEGCEDCGVRGTIPFRDANLRTISGIQERTAANRRATGRRIHGRRMHIPEGRAGLGYLPVTSSNEIHFRAAFNGTRRRGDVETEH